MRLELEFESESLVAFGAGERLFMGRLVLAGLVIPQVDPAGEGLFAQFALEVLAVLALHVLVQVLALLEEQLVAVGDRTPNKHGSRWNSKQLGFWSLALVHPES